MAGAEGAKPSGIVLAGIISGTVLAMLIQTLDTTIAAVALPHMQGSLSASQDEINWVITSYIVAVALMTAPSGWLANRFGRKQVMIFSMAGFIIASVLTGFAQSLDQVVLFRFLQGLCGAPMVPLSQSLLLDCYEPKDSVRALSWWALGTIIGPIIGPNLGGWITEHWEWRWVFFINVPFGILALLAFILFIPETRRQRLSFDWFGFAALSMAITCFQLVMDRGSEKDWFDSSEIVTEACLAALGLYIFCVHSATVAKPLIDFSALRDWNFTLGTLYLFINSGVVLAAMVMVPSFLQNLVGDPVGYAGIILMPRAMGSGVSLFLLGRLPRWVDPRLLAMVGLGMLCWELFRMSGWTADISSWEVVTNGFWQGVGVTTAYIPMQTITFAKIRPAQRNGASTLFGLTRNFGQSLGVSISTLLLVRNIQANHADIAAQVTPFDRALQSGTAGYFWNMGELAGRVRLDIEIQRQATTIAYADDFRVLMYVALLVIPILPFLRISRSS